MVLAARALLAALGLGAALGASLGAALALESAESAAPASRPEPRDTRAARPSVGAPALCPLSALSEDAPASAPRSDDRAAEPPALPAGQRDDDDTDHAAPSGDATIAATQEPAATASSTPKGRYLLDRLTAGASLGYFSSDQSEILSALYF